jgi:hypothetical protein
MRTPAAILITFASLVTHVHAQTSRPVWPSPPQVTVGANLKELVFDWEPVPGAVIYRVLRKSTDNPREYFAPIDEIRLRRTRAAIPISVHQQLWNTTRYIILACNLAGCSRSAEVFPRDLMLDTIGYFKASNTDANDRFGTQVAMSANGTTLAVSARGESSNATGVNGNQADNSAASSGAVYVFRRTGRSWAQEAYLKAPVSEPGAQFGSSSVARQRNLSISADGATLAVGAPGQSHAGLARAGVVYVFKRGADNLWGPHLELTAPPARANDQFGYSLDLSSDGSTLRASSMQPFVDDGEPEGRTHIWMYNGTSWSYSGAMAPLHAGDRCPSTRMSADGRTLVSYCLSTTRGTGRVVTQKRTTANTWVHANADFDLGWAGRNNMAINYAATWLAVNEYSSIGMYRWENARWVKDVNILPWTITNGGWAESIEFSRHGEFFAIGDPSANAYGAGVSDNAVMGTEPHGAVLIYKFRPEGIPMWYGVKQVKATNPQSSDGFGASVSFGGTGWYLAVGAPFEDGAATGVDGNQASNAKSSAGAVYLY